MALLKRVFGISVTSTPADEGCFTLGEGIVKIDLDRAPELRVEGSALRLESTDLTDRLLILHGIDGTFRAYTNVCACAGWRIDPVPGEQKVRCCTLAQSTYDYDGKKLSGSAKADLTTHAVEVDGDTLVVTLDST